MNGYASPAFRGGKLEGKRNWPSFRRFRAVAKIIVAKAKINCSANVKGIAAINIFITGLISYH
jgi:hypothetical protein